MEEILRKAAEYHANNREEILRKKNERYANNHEKWTVYYDANREEILRKKAEYRANNREKINEQDRARYARNREEILRKKAELRGPSKPKKPPKFKYQAAFNKRVREEKRYYCEVCDTAFSKPNELKRHFETKKHARNLQAPK